MHHFFSAHFSEWLLGSSPRELLYELHVCMAVHVFKRVRVCLCMWANHGLYVCLGCFCVLLFRMWCWRVCVHAWRMTFSEMWQREKKHLTHNWSAMKEIWSWICIRLTCSALNQWQEEEAACSASTLPYHPEGWLQHSKWCSTKMTEEKHKAF